MTMMTTDGCARFMAEWESHDSVMIAWPHPDTDWSYMLEEVTACYRRIVSALLEAEVRVLVVVPEAYDPGIDGVQTVYADTNDTWIRDYGPLSLSDGSLLDFRFNAWGQKFASNFDNQVNQAVFAGEPRLVSNKDFVLEGGSVETDGKGTLLTTACCLLAPNRNEPMTRSEIEARMLRRLNCRKVLWLECEALEGDDTDGHIDTIARMAPDNTIVYTVEGHRGQIEAFTDADGQPFRPVKLPMPDPIADPDDGSVLPATYANYLVAGNAVLMPTYGQPENDSEACRTIQAVFPDRKVIAVDCRALIRQHGSLHCATMQFNS